MQKKLLSLLFACTLAMSTMVGCGATTQQKVINDILKFEPVVLNVATAACAFISNPVCVSGAQKFKADADLVLKLWQDYLSTVGTQTVTAWTALNAALQTMFNDADSVFALLSFVPANLQPEILTLVAAAQALLAVLETMIPSSPAAASARRYTAHVPVGAFNLGKFVTDYNSKVDACQKVLPRGSKLQKVHIHSLTVRVLSAGLAK